MKPGESPNSSLRHQVVIKWFLDLVSSPQNPVPQTQTEFVFGGFDFSFLGRCLLTPRKMECWKKRYTLFRGQLRSSESQVEETKSANIFGRVSAEPKTSKMHVIKVSPADLGRYLGFVSRFSEAAVRARAQYHIFTSLPRI